MYTGPKINKDGLVLHLDGASERSLVSGSSTWVNLADTGTKYDGIIQNATYVPNHGGGLQFTTESTQRVLVPTGSEVNFGTGDFTIEIVAQSNDDSDRSTIIYRNDGSNDIGWYLEMRGKPTANPPQISNDLEDGVLRDNGMTGPNWVQGERFHHVMIRNGDAHITYHNGEIFNSQSLVGLGDVDFGPYIYIGGGGSLYGSVTVYMVRLYNRVLSADEVFQNYTSIFTRTEDYDVTRFINAVVNGGDTLDSGSVAAINYLVYGLKANGTWDKYHAIWPMVGGTEGAHKWNLKDPRDADDAFRLFFTGSWTHDASGSKGDGSTAWAQTYWRDSNATNFTTASNNDLLFGYYSNLDTGNGNYYAELGFDDGSGGTKDFLMQADDGSGQWRQYYGLDGRLTASSGEETYMVYAGNGDGTFNEYINGTAVGASSVCSRDPVNAYLTINSMGQVDSTKRATDQLWDSPRRCALACVGEGFTATDIANDFKVIDRFQYLLGRRNN